MTTEHAPWYTAKGWRYASQALDYGLLLPLMARLPLGWGMALAQRRGAFNAKRARDWAEMAVGIPYIGERCAASFRAMYPGISDHEVQDLVVQRYQTVAREELDAMIAIQGSTHRWHVDLEPVRRALAQRDPTRGLVVAMGHFDSVFLGLIAMARLGHAVYLMTSDVVLDPRVHPTIRRYYRAKYSRYEAVMGGGRLLPTASASKATFQEVLQGGGIVVVATETPAGADPTKGTWVEWMGQRRRMADSSLRMAIDTDSLLMGMSSKMVRPGHYVWEGTPMSDPRDHAASGEQIQRERTYAPIVAFIEQNILHEPGRWWASHLLGVFPTADEDVAA